MNDIDILLGKYEKLSNRMDRILHQGDRQQLKVLKLTEELELKNKKISLLLDNAGQGFLYFNKDMIIGSEYSKGAIRILGDNIVGKDITTLLYPNNSAKQLFVKETFALILSESAIMQPILLSLVQKEFEINSLFIEVEYKILDEENFMLILTDLTSAKELAQKIKDEQQILKMVVEIVTTKDQFMEIKHDYLNMTEHIQSFKSIEKLSDLRREIHTYKGLFAQKEMLNIVKKLHDYETIIDISITKNELDKRLVDMTSLDMSNWLDLDINIVKQILGDNYFDKNNLIAIDKDRIKSLYLKVIDYFKTNNNADTESIVKDLKEFQYHNIKIFFRPYEKLVEQLSVKLNKSINPLLLKCEDIYISNEYQPFFNSLVHIFRNSVDHGIEIPEDRLEIGKDASGTIVCDISKNNNSLNINIYDDGKGIDIKIISMLAVKKGIYTNEEISKLQEQDILLIIFEDAFSTSDTVTDISGRGVGLASILSELNKLDGKLIVNNDFGKGIEFKFTIPLIQD